MDNNNNHCWKGFITAPKINKIMVKESHIITWNFHNIKFSRFFFYFLIAKLWSRQKIVTLLLQEMLSKFHVITFIFYSFKRLLNAYLANNLRLNKSVYFPLCDLKQVPFPSFTHEQEGIFLTLFEENRISHRNVYFLVNLADYFSKSPDMTNMDCGWCKSKSWTPVQGEILSKLKTCLHSSVDMSLR